MDFPTVFFFFFLQIDGLWQNIPANIFSQLIRGMCFVNVMTTRYPAGEVRGQIMTVPKRMCLYLFVRLASDDLKAFTYRL